MTTLHQLHTTAHSASHHITCHTAFHITHHSTPYHTGYALNCILHDTIPHYIITYCTSQLHFTPHSHIPCQFPYLTPNLNHNIPQSTTSYYTFELHNSAPFHVTAQCIPHHSAQPHNSASCTIPRHSTVYSTSQHSVFHVTVQCIPHHSAQPHNSASCTIPRHSTVYSTSQHSVFHVTAQCIPHHSAQPHNSASCTIPRHSTVYSTSQHSVFHITAQCIPHHSTVYSTSQHTASFHIAPPQLFFHTAYHSTLHHHILLHNIPQHTSTFCTTLIVPHLTSLTIPHHHILHITAALYIRHILHHIQHHTIPHRTPSKYCTSQLHSTPHRCIPHHITTCMVTCITLPHHTIPYQTLLYLALPHHTMFHIRPTHITFQSRLPHLTIRSSFRITPTHSTSHHVITKLHITANSTLHITAAFYTAQPHSTSHHHIPYRTTYDHSMSRHISYHTSARPSHIYIQRHTITRHKCYTLHHMLHITVAFYTTHTHYPVFVGTNTGYCRDKVLSWRAHLSQQNKTKHDTHKCNMLHIAPRTHYSCILHHTDCPVFVATSQQKWCFVMTKKCLLWHVATNIIVLTSFDMTNVCCDKSMLVTTTLSWQKLSQECFAAAKMCLLWLLSWQKLCCDMHTSVAAKDMFKYAYRDNFCHDKIVFAKTDFCCFVTTKLLLQKPIVTKLCLSWHSFVVTKEVFCHEPNKLKTNSATTVLSWQTCF